MLGAVFMYGGAEGSVSLLAETYGTELGSGTADDITDAVKLEPALLRDIRRLLRAASSDGALQEGDGENSGGLQQVSANPQT